MLLTREVLAWLRYAITQDPICLDAEIRAEETPSTFIPFNDRTDGTRTISIYRRDTGLTPRLEVRFTGLRPQVFFVDAGNQMGDLIEVPVASGFPGDNRSLDVSDFVLGLVLLTKSKLCHSTKALLEMITVKATATIKLDDVKRVLDAVKRSLSPGGKPLTAKSVNAWLKTNTSGDLMDFARSVVEYFIAGKLEWADLDSLENKSGKGLDIIPWSFFKQQLSDPKIRGKLPANILEEITSSTTHIKKELDAIVEAYTDGKNFLPLHPLRPAVKLGLEVDAALRSGELPLAYLELMERCDPRERVLPWSYLRRKTIAFKITSATDDGNLEDSIVNWLKANKLLAPLYQFDDEVLEESITMVLKKAIQSHIRSTIDNKAWTRFLLDSLVGTDPLDQQRSLQIEFDNWVLNALSPSISMDKLPLSPHAFTETKRAQPLYDTMFKQWVRKVKDYLYNDADKMGPRLAKAIREFYDFVIRNWDERCFREYKPQIPSSNLLKTAAVNGNKAAFLQLLVDDLEGEKGCEVPASLKDELLANPFLNKLYQEIRLQSLKIG